MSELHILTGYIDFSFLSYYPLVDRIARSAGMDIGISHLQPVGSPGEIAAVVIIPLGKDLRIGGTGSLQEPPSVGPLFR